MQTSTSQICQKYAFCLIETIGRKRNLDPMPQAQFSALFAAASSDGTTEDRVEVNQRHLIDKILAR
jgi:hypothetical protein